MKINILNDPKKWKNRFPERIETENQTGRKMTREDISLIDAGRIDSGIFNFIRDIENTKDLLTWLDEKVGGRNYLFYMFYKKNGQDILFASNLTGLAMLSRTGRKKTEIGGWIFKEYRNTGYGSEIMAAFNRLRGAAGTNYGFYAETDPANTAAVRILEKNGFLRENRFPGVNGYSS